MLERVWGKRTLPHALLVGMEADAATVGNSMKVPQKTRVAMWPSNPTPLGILPGQNHNSERGVHPYVQSNTIYISRDTETEMSINRWTDKENVVYLYIATPWIVGH